MDPDVLCSISPARFVRFALRNGATQSSSKREGKNPSSPVDHTGGCARTRYLHLSIETGEVGKVSACESRSFEGKVGGKVKDAER